MPDYLPGFIKDCLTGIDGQSFDAGRVGFMFSLVLYFGLGISEEFRASPDYPFEYDKFGYGLAAIVTAFGALLKLKERTEPGAMAP